MELTTVPEQSSIYLGRIAVALEEIESELFLIRKLYEETQKRDGNFDRLPQ